MFEDNCNGVENGECEAGGAGRSNKVIQAGHIGKS